MKLSPYDYCPFCVRADMVANYKQVEREKIYLSNDDEATCFELIGAKKVPILQLNDGSRMGERLDIA
ncbi:MULTISPECIES: glutathione S-transferase N-terminal domain-containing protein [Pseudomonas]|jgi:glutaredoxin 2|uniref:Glutaredoxin 2 n=1 Tax=Pseudomonas lutea TaxID=243924 RepID=A0A9X8MB92_9PSED|nr:MULTISPECIES: glutathione S-transferase N-terminal domain-containing protein [Pseudomonas]SEQ20267.1 glutaredoxin 2 [Pseudomonas lutea]